MGTSGNIGISEHESISQPASANPQVLKRPWTFPRTIRTSDLLKGKESTKTLLCEYLVDHGYAVLSTESVGEGDFKDHIATLHKDRVEYFAQEQDKKMDNCINNGRNNIGYVKGGNSREYIMVRISDGEDVWPKYPPLLSRNLKDVYSILHEIAWNVFDAVAHYGGPDNKLSDPETLGPVKELVATHSSIGLIHYFKNEEPCVCKPHEDTGLITIGVRPEIPGLTIWDRLKNDWVEVEKLTNEGDLICFIGHKLPLFSGCNIWNATTHKVEIPVGTERNSLVFQLDVAK